MTKKLLKYGKIMMALALIVSLTLPSYATVGAADGSAFVTKAEFDSALSDFNARLTTFEAGINSKIDSQVSSYLDRNGIWNAKEQTLTGASITVSSLSKRANSQSWETYSGPTYLFKANKSGMAFLYNSISSSAAASVYTGTSSSTYARESTCFAIGVIIHENASSNPSWDSEVPYKNVQVYSADMTATYVSRYYQFWVSVPTGTYIFFVSKDKSYYFSAYKFGYGCNASMQTCSIDQQTLYLKKCYVY